ncbi:hypothetical protein F5I97DRAFT_1830408 [Phlebopus sp. FC_14]|nr:hypothetical protein F5I97DRAFT_1830408 [Phlebopus sp. FC_14]
MSSSTHAENERDAQLMSIGHQCSESSCLLVDFLPFKCQHCEQCFCGEHFLVAAHKCPKYDESKHNRVAPNCPLCNIPVAIPPGEDPNIRMERHISHECSVMTGKSGRTTSTPVCARGKCGKVLFSPIVCDSCRKQYCAQHRFPKDHRCTSLAAPTTSSQRIVQTARFNKPNTSQAASKSAGSSSSPSPGSSRATASVPAVSISNPFSKTDRRAKAERESRRKAMLQRAKKGLLTEQEKLILAEESARAHQDASSKDKECTIM